MFVLWFLPVAFVSLSTNELEDLGAWRRLKIFSAGVWHNLILALVAYVCLIHVVPAIFAPLFQVVDELQLDNRLVVKTFTGL